MTEISNLIINYNHQFKSEWVEKDVIDLLTMSPWNFYSLKCISYLSYQAWIHTTSGETIEWKYHSKYHKYRKKKTPLHTLEALPSLTKYISKMTTEN